MPRPPVLIAALLLAASSAFAADRPVIPLYDGAAPGSESWTWPETEQASADGIRRVANVTKPTLTVFAPPAGKANGTGIVVCPGGGFRILAINHEGEDVATWLNERGVTVFLLKYRLMRTGDGKDGDREEMARRRVEVIPLAVADGRRAVAVARQHAARYGVRPDRLGILGFSAGGWVTAAVAMQGQGSSRPDFAAPIYAATPEQVSAPSNPMPLFLVHAADDKTVPVGHNSIRLFTAWHEAGAPAELHVYSQGAHGFGMRTKNLPSDTWIARFADWLKAQQLVP